MVNITLDPITKRFTQVIPEEKTCYICNSNSFVDDHHIDLKHGKISPITVPLCRRCHRTIHMYNGIHMFDDVVLDKAIEVWNITQILLNRPLMIKDKIKRSKYWNKKHGIKGGEGISGSQTPVFPFHLPRGEPICGQQWVNEHLFDLMDYVPRIEIIHPDLHLTVDVNSKKKLLEVSKALRGLRKDGDNKRKQKKAIVLDPVSKRFLEVKDGNK